MKELLIMVVLVALVSSFNILLLIKLGFVEWVQVYGKRLFSKLFNCMFCLSFWMGFVVSGIYVLVSKDLTGLLVPFLAAPITRRLI